MLVTLILTMLVAVSHSFKHCSRLLGSSRLIVSSGRESIVVTNPSNESGTKDGGQFGGKKVSASIGLDPPRGTRDFYPEDFRVQMWLFNNWRSVATSYGFEEYDAPIVENEALYIRKAGEEVTQQLYNFEDKGGRKLSLRPEMTPSLARMVMSKKNALPFPLKWFSIPQCWRYERTTRGRRREHYQWNMDIWGVETVHAEAELLSSIVTFMRRIGITSEDVGIKINNRKILTSLMTKFGIPEEKWMATFVLIDKLEKVPLENLSDDLTSIGLTNDDIVRLLDSLQIKSLDELKTLLGEDDVGYKEISLLFELAENYNISDWITFDASVVRGLAYYTGIVFEGFDKLGELRAIFGGGRYDTLLDMLGGSSTPAVGFGFGDAVIVELLKMKKLLPDFSKTNQQILVYGKTERCRTSAIKLATILREQKYSVDLVLEEKKPKWAFQRADKFGTGKVSPLFRFVPSPKFPYHHSKN